MGISKPKPPTHRASLCLDKGGDKKAIWMDLVALWPGRNRENVLSGRLSLACDLTLRAGDPLFLIVQPISSDKNPEAPAASDDDAPF